MAKAVKEPALSPHAQLIDELGAIEKRLAPLQADITRRDALRSAIRDVFADEPAGDSCEARGEKFVVRLGPRGLRRIIDLTRLRKAIGPKALAGLVTATVTAVERYGAEARIPALAASCSSQEATGPRSLAITPRDM